MTTPQGGIPEYPEGNANTIIEWAEKAGKQEVVDLVHQIKDWLGKPTEIDTLTSAWGHDAKGLIFAAQDNLGTAKQQAGFYWSGNAYDEYGNYLQDFSKVVDSVAGQNGVLTAIGSLLSDVHGYIIEVYQQGVDFIIKTAKSIVDQVNSIIGAAEQAAEGALSKVSPGILGALSDFLTNVQDVLDAATKKFNEFYKTATTIQSNAAQVPAVRHIAASESDPSQWSVKKAQGS